MIDQVAVSAYIKTSWQKPEAKVALIHSDDLNDVLTDVSVSVAVVLDKYMTINLLQNGMLDHTSLNKIKGCIEFHEEHCEC